MMIFQWHICLNTYGFVLLATKQVVLFSGVCFDAILCTISTSYSHWVDKVSLYMWAVNIVEKTRVYEQYKRQDHPLENTETNIAVL